MAWINLLIASVFEIAFALLLKESESFTKLWPTIGFSVCAMLSLFFLTRAIQVLPLGTAYAIWTGIGAAGTVIAGAYLYAEPIGLARMFFLGLLIISVIGLKFVTQN